MSEGNGGGDAAGFPNNGGRFSFPVNVQSGTPPLPAGIQKAIDDARKSGNWYIIVCNADDATADCAIQIHSERSGTFHRGNLVRAWQKAGMQILEFDPAIFDAAIHRLMPKIAEMVTAEINKGASDGNGNHATGVDEPISD